MNHEEILLDIAMTGEDPEKSLARKELKKARYSAKTLTEIYRNVLFRAPNTYPPSITDAAKKYLEQAKREAAKTRSDIVNIRLSAAERAELENRAKEKGISLSQYIRDVLFAGKENE